LDIQQIKEYLPHRYPFLLIDRVVECEPGVRLLGYKNVTYNEPFFTGHFPQQPIMPGVLIIEALAQTTGLLAAETAPSVLGKGKTYYLVGLDKVRFKRQVVPGETLRLECRITRSRGPIGWGEATASVDGELACSGELMFATK
jgi:3-hydroxyacyl-[acyl-carrier-protein] dehydratase